MKVRLLAPTLVLLVVVSACAPASTTSQIPTAGQAWRSAPLLDARTGESFTIDSLRGKLVAVEPMAIWCTNCRVQQGEAATALDRLASPDIVYISVDVDPNERSEDLARYAEGWGYDWPFVIVSADLARSLAESFGAQVLSPPSTPLILIGPDGAVLDLHFGIRSADDLVELFSQHLS